jgi:hypothetical protein
MIAKLPKTAKTADKQQQKNVKNTIKLSVGLS